jgi:hypothetical protein
LRNAALTLSVYAVAQPGLHIQKIWMTDPGIVLDMIEAEASRTWLAEIRINNLK